MLAAIRLTHIAGALFNLLFVYTPLHQWPHGFAVVQFISMPLLIVTGVLMARTRKQRLVSS